MLLNFTEFQKYLKICEVYCILNVRVLNSQSVLATNDRGRCRKLILVLAAMVLSSLESR